MIVIFIKMKKIIVMLLLLMFYPVAFVNGITADPEKMESVESLYIDCVYTLSQSFIIKNDSSSSRRCEAIIPIASPKTEGYEQIPDTSWISLAPNSFSLEPGGTQEVDVTISIPNDVDYIGRKFEAPFKVTATGTDSFEGVYSRICFTVSPYAILFGTQGSSALTKIGMLGNRIVFNLSFQTMGEVVEKVNLFYRKKGQGSYVQTPFSLTGEGSSYTGRAIIPKEAITLDGLEYYIEMIIEGETVVYAPFNAPDVPYTIEVDMTSSSLVSRSEGGTVTVDDGNPEDGETSVSISRNALTDSKTITIGYEAPETAGVPSSSHRLILSDEPVAVYDFSPENLEFKKGLPATLTMLYLDNESDESADESDGVVDDSFPPIDATTLRIFYWDGFDWRYVGGTVNTENHTVTAKISHFSKYALFPAAEYVAKDFRPFERIITPNADGWNDYADFNALDGDVKIFDITGKKIRVLKGSTISGDPYIETRWDGRDDDGDIVESGVYIYQYMYDGERVSGVIAVAK